MRDHLQPKPNEISQRYVFYKRDRKVDESIKDYVAELRKLSEHCNFNQNLEDSLRDKLVCSLNDKKIQQKLLATRNLTLESAIDTAVAMEAAIRSARDLHVLGRGDGFLGGVYRLDKGGSTSNSPWNSLDRRECYRCGSSKHLADACIYKNKECFGCKRTGHVRRKCPNARKKGKFGKFGVGVNRVPVIESDKEVLEGVEGLL